MSETTKKYKYEGMTEKQINVLNRFMQYKAATETQKKMVQIIGESNMIKDWIYWGFIDTGVFGKEHCSLGHPLRYVHYAKNLKTREVVKFGINCISEFFNITPEKLKMIKKGFIEINDMVNDIIDKFNNNYDYNEYKSKLELIDEKPEHYREIQLLLDTDLPLPYCYEKEINKIIAMENASKEFNEFLDNNPQYLSLVVMAKFLSSDMAFKASHPILFEKMNNIVNFLEVHKKLSESQLKLLNKIILLDFNDLDSKIEELNLLPRDSFMRRGNYDEYWIFKDIVVQYNDWGLSVKQVELINKIYNRNKSKIDLLQNEQFKLVE